MLKRKTLPVGALACNCSILYCEKTLEAAVIDPGADEDKIRKELTSLGLKVKFVLHTHAHFDHCGATKELKAANPNMKIAFHKDDELMYQNLPMQGQMFGYQYETPPPVDLFLKDSEELKIGDEKFSVIHTPGHSPGGVCFHFAGGVLASSPVLFSGDTLFQSSIGRSDLWGGDHDLLIKSIKQRLLTLDDQTFVMPGHGPSTEIGREKKANPYLR